jgi:hypothetical protein
MDGDLLSLGPGMSPSATPTTTHAGHGKSIHSIELLMSPTTSSVYEKISLSSDHDEEDHDHLHNSSDRSDGNQSRQSQRKYDDDDDDDDDSDENATLNTKKPSIMISSKNINNRIPGPSSAPLTMSSMPSSFKPLPPKPKTTSTNGTVGGVDQVSDKLAHLSIPAHLQKKILVGGRRNSPLSPSSPLSPRMISAIEKERALAAKTPIFIQEHEPPKPPSPEPNLIEMADTPDEASTETAASTVLSELESIASATNVSTVETTTEAYVPPPATTATTNTTTTAPTTTTTTTTVTRPISIMRRTKIIVKTITEEDTDFPKIIPIILSYVKHEPTLRTCLFVSKAFMYAAVGELYKHISLTGSCGPVLNKLVRLMALSQEGKTMCDYRPLVRSLHVADMVLDEPEVTPYQSWNMARELIRRVAPTLENLVLDSDDGRFGDPELVPPGSCGLDQRVFFPKIKSLTIGAGCLAFPDDFIFDLMRRCPNNVLQAIRFPGCITNMTGNGYYLIAEKGGEALEELIMTPPSSYPPPYPTEHQASSTISGMIPGSRRGSTSSISSLSLNGGTGFGSNPGGSTHGSDQEISKVETLNAFDPNNTWEPDLFADGIQILTDACPNLKALDISGHIIGLRAGMLETLLNGCLDLEELDLPCGMTDANMYEVLMNKPEHLWRLNIACSCHRTHSDPVTARNAHSYIPCSFLTDGVVKALLDEIMVGKPGALIELPTHVMEVSSARMLPTLTVLEDVAGAKVDMNDTNAIYIPRIGVRAYVPNGRLLT